MTTPPTPPTPPGGDHPPAPPAQPTGFPAASPRPRSFWGTTKGQFVIIGIIFACVAAGIGLVLLGQPSNEDEAVEACHDTIRGKLRSPSSARFLGTPSMDHSDGSSVYRISGEMDAQNGFGAIVRGTYRCTMGLEKDGSWVATIAEFDQR